MNGHQKLGRIAPAIACLLLGCAPGIPTEALQINPQTLAQREASSRSYDTGNEGEILSASVQVLQDLGFTIDRTAADAGLVTASKQRDATEGGRSRRR